MKRRSSISTAFILTAFFAFGVLCTTFAAPGQAFVSASGCSQTSGAMAMQDCDFPSYLCGWDSKTELFFQGVLRSARPGDSLQHSLGLAPGALRMGASTELAYFAAGAWRNMLPAGPGKVSIRLFNSVLNL